MGLFDMFGKKKKEESKEAKKEEFDVYDIDVNIGKLPDIIQKTTSIPSASASYNTDTKTTKGENINLSSTERAMIDVAVNQYRELTNKTEINKMEKELEKYKKISGLLLSSEWGLGIWRKDNKEDFFKYRKLSEKDRKCFFFPFLIEKKEMGLAIDIDLSKMERMRKDSSMSINEQYTRGLVLLQKFKLINITDTDTFSKTFNTYSEMKREEIKSQADLEVMMEDSPKTDGFEGKKNYL